MINKKPYRWNADKNQAIAKRHGLCFEMLLSLEPIYLIEKHNPQKYPRQDAYIFVIDDYPVFVPFVEEDDYIFFKNMIPKREYKHLLEDKK